MVAGDVRDALRRLDPFPIGGLGPEVGLILFVADADGQDVMIYRPLIKYATIMVSVIPMMMLYPFVQRYFVSGVMIGAVKG